MMPVLNTPQELLQALGEVPFSKNPVADLAAKGYSLSSALQGQWQSAMAGKTLAPAPPGVSPQSLKRKITFQKPAIPGPPPPEAPGSYDVAAGVTLGVADQVLDAVYQSGTIPHQIALDQLLSPTVLTALGGSFVVDKPGGTISRLHITSAPTIAAIADGSSEVAVEIPIQIDWSHTRMLAGRQIRQLVTKATGTLQLTMALKASVAFRVPTSQSILTITVELLTNTTPADSPRLTLDANSPVQRKSPAPPNQIDGLAQIIQNALSLQFKNRLSFPVSPEIDAQVSTLDIRQVDVVTQGGALIVGLKVVGTNGAGSPATLRNVTPDAQSNIFVQVQDAVANQLIQQALRNGSLTAQAKQKYSNASVDSASAWFEKDAFVAQIHGSLEDECPFNVDLGFTFTRKVTIKLLGGSIEIDQSDDQSIAEAGNLWCLLTTLGLIGLAALGGWVISGVGVAIGAGVVSFLLSDIGGLITSNLFGGGGGSPTPQIIPLTSPIPGSDVLPTVSGGTFQVSDHVMVAGAVFGTTADNINTVIYARFLAPDGIAIMQTKPLAGVKVELMDQDAPAPAGDDVVPVVPHDTVTVHNEIIDSTKYSYEKPGSDQKLAEGQTDLDGTVRFALLKSDLITTAGDIKAVITHTDINADKDKTTISRSPVGELKPDLYFRITMPDGSVVDSRKFSGGFFENFSSSRIGTLANPLTITLGASVGGANA
jgi:hypothetical protein